MQVTLLGTGAALSDGHRTTTMLAVRPENGGTSGSGDGSGPAAERRMSGGVWLIDCGGDVAQRFMMARGLLSEIRGLILTHEHIDHVAGFPLLMEKLWLAGRREPLPIYGPEPAIAQARRTFEAFDTNGWTGMPERAEHVVDPDRDSLVLTAECEIPGEGAVGEGAAREDFTVKCAWGRHSKPVIALRFEDTHGVCTYSADTEYCDSVVELARGSDLLVHEATGAFPGHTTAGDAARVAVTAGARRLVLVHLPGESPEFDAELEHARHRFSKTDPGEELRTYDVPEHPAFE